MFTGSKGAATFDVEFGAVPFKRKFGYVSVCQQAKQFAQGLQLEKVLCRVLCHGLLRYLFG